VIGDCAFQTGDQSPAVLGQLQYACHFAGLNVNDLKFPLSEDDYMQYDEAITSWCSYKLSNQKPQAILNDRHANLCYITAESTRDR